MSGKITRKRGRTSAGRGLVVAALRGLTQAGFSELEIKKYVIPQRTRRNRADKNQTLTVEESDRAVRLLRVQTLAEVSFADKEKANRWLRRALTELGGEAPLCGRADRSGRTCGRNDPGQDRLGRYRLMILWRLSGPPACQPPPMGYGLLFDGGWNGIVLGTREGEVTLIQLLGLKSN